jgi:hypothetical protein
LWSPRARAGKARVPETLAVFVKPADIRQAARVIDPVLSFSTSGRTSESRLLRGSKEVCAQQWVSENPASDAVEGRFEYIEMDCELRTLSEVSRELDDPSSWTPVC